MLMRGVLRFVLRLPIGVCGVRRVFGCSRGAVCCCAALWFGSFWFGLVSQGTCQGHGQVRRQGPPTGRRAVRRAAGPGAGRRGYAGIAGIAAAAAGEGQDGGGGGAEAAEGDSERGLALVLNKTPLINTLLVTRTRAIPFRIDTGFVGLPQRASRPRLCHTRVDMNSDEARSCSASARLLVCTFARVGWAGQAGRQESTEACTQL